mmetsp:Transcript_11575/g.17490  ORF Transcript_11575/g.17490 Transcript_11575/m.17490 type:complete len:179 (+) Transcript_11575:1222-1758(+)
MPSFIQGGQDLKTVGITMTSLAFGIVVIYNVVLGIQVFKRATSVDLHESYLVKKEVEYTLGLSSNWSTHYFFFFSSYRGGVQRMVFRPFFNLFCVLLVAIHSSLGDNEASKIFFIQALFMLLMVFVLAFRPYRCLHSNATLILLTMLINLVMFQLNLKIAGFSSALFVDKYFYWMQLV